MTTMRRDWSGRTIAETPIAYVDNTGTDTSMFHTEILRAIANGGTFSEDFADIFRLTRPAGVWVLEFV